MILEKVVPPLSSSIGTERQLSTAVRFFEALNGTGVRYCHWKSNIRLEVGLAGRTDLDLLVDIEDEDKVRGLLAEHGFKQLVAPLDKQFPGVEHLLGFDWDTGSLIHVHLHFKLVLGEQMIKNYCLPLEEQFLDAAVLRSGVRVPAAELDLIILSLRALLKYRDRDVIKDVLKIRSPGIPGFFLDEIGWLTRQVTPESFEKALASVSSLLPVESIRRFLTLAREQPRSGWQLLRLRNVVRRGLRRYQRHERLAASFIYFKALFRKSRQGDRQMGLPHTGRRFALVGADGSGKTSLSQALANWLSWKIDTHLLYLGSKQPSRFSAALYWFFRIARRLQTEIIKLWGARNFLARLTGRIKNYLLAQHHLSNGRDRLRRYQLGSRLAQAGSVVFFDRFPFKAPLDGPEIERIPTDNPAELTGLTQKEKKLYQQFQPVDRLFLLETPVDVSYLRKPDHPREVIQSKNDAMEQLKERLSAPDTAWNWLSVDASLPKDEVLLTAKRAVWEAL